MKILDRYILVNFMAVFIGSLVSVSFLFEVISILDSLERLMAKQGASLAAIVKYYSYQLPQTIYMGAPIAALLSSMIVLGAMSQSNELTAIRASGISLARTAMPILAASVLIGTALFWLGNSLVPVGNRFFLSAKQEIKGEADEEEEEGNRVWYVSEEKGKPPVILRIEDVDRETGKLKGVTVFKTGPEFALETQTVALFGSPLPEGGWALEKARIRDFSGNGPPAIKTMERTTLNIPDGTEEFLRVQRAPEEMTLPELSRQMDRIKKHGLPDAAYRVEWHTRFAIPMATLILVMVGAPLAVRPVRTSGTALSILGAVLVGFSYYVIIAEFISLGKGSIVKPAPAAWSANAIYAVIGLGLYSRLRK